MLEDLTAKRQQGFVLCQAALRLALPPPAPPACMAVSKTAAGMRRGDWCCCAPPNFGADLIWLAQTAATFRARAQNSSSNCAPCYAVVSLRAPASLKKGLNVYLKVTSAAIRTIVAGVPPAGPVAEVCPLASPTSGQQRTGFP